MKEELQRLAIAEACGWKWMRRMNEEGEPTNWNQHSVWLFTPGHLEGVDCCTVPVGRFERCAKPEHHNGFAYGSPDYLHDVNAMIEAEKVLENHPTDKPWSSAALDCAESRFVHHLLRIVGAKLIQHKGLTTYGRLEELKLVRATARQRAEAFLKALNLWSD